VQNRYSFADREWDYVVDYCERNGIAFYSLVPSGGGARGGSCGRRPGRIARAHQATPMQVAIAWLLAAIPHMLPIPGTSSVEHLEENVAAASVRLNGRRIQKALRGFPR